MDRQDQDIFEALKESEEKFSKAFHSSAALMALSTLEEGRFLEINEEFLKTLGYAREEVLQKTSKELDIFINYQQREELVQLLKAQGMIKNYPAEIKTKNGDLRYGLFSAHIIHIKNLPCLLTVFNDTTELKFAEEALKKSEEKYRLITENTNDLICITNFDLTANFIYVNSAYERILGYKAGELIGKSCFYIVHPEDTLKYIPLLKKYIGLKIQSFFKKDISGLAENIDFKLKDKTGNYRYFACTVNIIDEKRLLFISKDMTQLKKAETELKNAYVELKKTQQQLIQSGKLAAMGQLAAGISHELAQPLTGIRGFAQTILIDLPEADPMRKDLEQIIYQADRMDAIIKNVRFFAKKSEFALKNLSITNPLDNALMLLEAQLRRNGIEVDKQIRENLPLIQADGNQLQQLFINLITNAKDAILLNNSQNKQIRINAFLSEDQKNVVISFADSGGGIPENQISYIFNPFYTTKAPDGGMGLGLSICYRIIENHKAQIKVENEPEKGAKFIISFPAVKNNS